MLDRVPLLEKDLPDYAGAVGVDVVDRILRLAEPLQGARVLHINATAYGGGVAELLATHVPLLRSVGLDADWQVMQGSDLFFGGDQERPQRAAGRGHRVDAGDAEASTSRRSSTTRCSSTASTTSWSSTTRNRRRS